MAEGDETELTKQQPKPLAPPLHETIRIRVQIGGRDYMACGFLKAKEPSCRGRIMLERTSKIEGTHAIDNDEWKHLWENRSDFNNYPELDRSLATDRHHPAYPGNLCYFVRRDGKWDETLVSAEAKWGECLVLRRCT